MLKKLLFLFVVLLYTGTSVFAYTPNNKDKVIIMKLTNAIEKVIKQKGESKRTSLVVALEKIQKTDKYKSNDRIQFVLQNVIGRIESKVPDLTSTNYIITEGSVLLEGSRKNTHFSVYKSNGELLQKIQLPDSAKDISAVDSTKVYGEKVYYLNGTREKTYITEVDPVTGIHRDLLFTEQETTNPGNTLFSIVSWAVSTDNKIIARMDTDGNIYVANQDGTNKKTYKATHNKPITAKMQISNDVSSLYVRSNDMLEKINLSTDVFSTLAETENGSFFISHNDNYLVYSNFDNPLVIHNLNNSKEIYVDMPKYDVLDFYDFSLDESKVYIQGRIVRGEFHHYVIETDSGKISKLEDTRLKNYFNFLSEKFAVTSCRNGIETETCLVDITNTTPETSISNELFLGIIK